jgi:hypothetical protein
MAKAYGLSDNWQVTSDIFPLGESTRRQEMSLGIHVDDVSKIRLGVKSCNRHQDWLWIRMAKVLVYLVSVSFVLSSCIRDLPLSSSVDTSTFDGKYTLDEDRSLADFYELIENTEDEDQRENLEFLLSYTIDSYADFTIKDGVIYSGKVVIEGYELTSATTENGVLRGNAFWWEDVYDPGDFHEAIVTMSLEGGTLEFVAEDPHGEWVTRVWLTKSR